MFTPAAGSGHSSHYKIPNSLRLRASSSAYLSRTFTSTPLTYTISVWFKRGTLGVTQEILASRYTGGTNANLELTSNDTIAFTVAGTNLVTTTAVYRDPSAWYHVVVKVTPSALSYLYVNNVQIASFTAPASPWIFNSSAGYVNTIGRYGDASSFYYDGYLAEINFIDGQALDPTYFGRYCPNNPKMWEPKAYTGTYGTNGFYLPFTNGSTLTTLGADASGAGNNWTLSGVSLTAGANYDWMIDTPTNNFATLNPVHQVKNSSGNPSLSLTVSNGNLSFSQGNAPASTWSNPTDIFGTSRLDPGFMYYFEWTPSITGYCEAYTGIGTMAGDAALGSSGTNGSPAVAGITSTSYGVFYHDSGTGTKNTQVYAGGVSQSGWTLSSTIVSTFRCAVDLLNNRIWFGADNYWLNGSNPALLSTGIPITQTTYLPWFAISNYSNGTYSCDVNFGQRPFTYAPPVGYRALCSANLAPVSIPDPSKHFDVATWTGNSGSQTITGLGFKPGLWWTKNRANAYNHMVIDAIRGINNRLTTNTTDAESATTTLVSLNSDGFSVDNSNSNNVGTQVAWNWNVPASAVTNNAGSITSQVSANTTAGFSVITATAPASGNFTIGHGLGSVPKFFITKPRNRVTNWVTYHAGLNGGNPGTTYYLNLNTADTQLTFANNWGSAAPTSSVLGMGVGASCAAGDTLSILAFSEVPGFSKFGSYTGNGLTDGPFVYCGFRPRYILYKAATGTAYGWTVYDTARDTYNVEQNYLMPNTSASEAVQAQLDIVSNGFKVRIGAAGNCNESGSTYIFAAFAELPVSSSYYAPPVLAR